MTAESDAQLYRRLASRTDIRTTVERVRAGGCTCCPGEGAELGSCGHRFCGLCLSRHHDGERCVACALAM